MNHKITNLALVKLFHSEQMDIIDTFIPFVEYAVYKAETNYPSISELQKSITEFFNINIPLSTLRSILKKLKHNNQIKVFDDSYFEVTQSLSSDRL